jgi:hypothetical protein
MACNRSNASGPRTSHDAFRSHAQAVTDKVAHCDLPFALEVGWPRFQPHDMRLLKLELGGVFAGDDAFVVVDKLGEAVQKRRFSRTGTS